MTVDTGIAELRLPAITDPDDELTGQLTKADRPLRRVLQGWACSQAWSDPGALWEAAQFATDIGIRYMKTRSKPKQSWPIWR